VNPLPLKLVSVAADRGVVYVVDHLGYLWASVDHREWRQCDGPNEDDQEKAWNINRRRAEAARLTRIVKQPTSAPEGP
jgi:hypothetical protein